MGRKVLARFEMIANQMIYGMDARSEIDPIHIERFKETHKDLINWLDENMPRQTSLGVAGALGKAALWYGREKAEKFLLSLKNLTFEGPCDPAHVLYVWLMSRTRHDPKDAYKRTVTAFRYYAAGKELYRLRDGENRVGYIIPSKKDIFKWDKTLTKMLSRRKKDSQSSEEDQMESPTIPCK